MRFSSYLKEAVLKANPKDINLIKNVLIKKWKTFLKKRNSLSSERDMWKELHKLMDNASKEISRNIKDVDFKFESGKGKVKASVRMGFPKHPMTVYYNIDDLVDSWNTDDDFIFKGWLGDLLSIIEHEMVHIEQYRRLSKEKDPEKAVRILDVQHLKNDKKYSVQADAYLNYSLEIMAHAKSVDSELKYFDNDEIIDMLKNDEGQNELAMESPSFDKYYINIKDRFPKTWKKFIKYLIMYVEKRK